MKFSYIFKKLIEKLIIDKNVYSTDEVVVGTWVDGKPIYRRVIEKILTKDYFEGEVSCCFFRINDTTISQIIDLKIFVKISDNQTFGLGTDKTLTGSFTSNSNGMFYCNWLSIYDEQFIGEKGVFIFEYTKTTD